MNCPLSDLVIARFLDGDLTGARDGDGLAQHANDCAACRLALARSRQLDAVLASACGDGLSEAAAARILATVRAPRAAAERRPRSLVLLLAAGFVVGLATAWLWPTSAPTTVTTARVAETVSPPVLAQTGPSQVAPQALPPQWIAIEVETTTVAANTPRPVEPSRVTTPNFDNGEMVANAMLQAYARHQALGLVSGAVLPLDLTPAVDAARVSAGRWQLDAGAPLTELLEILHRDEPAAQVLLTHAAGHRGFRQRLLTWLNRSTLDPRLASIALSVAVRLGDAELDRLALARIRRDEPLAERLAQACARAATGVSRTGFLLDLWTTLTRCSGDDSGDPLGVDTDRARRWFAPLPDANRELLDLLSQTRSNEVRRRVVLVLAARAPAAGIVPLLQLVDGANAELAHLATFALGCYDHAAIPRLRQAARQTRRPDLVWTALLSIGDAAARARLPRLDLSPTETALLKQGPLHPAQVASFAAALRNRPLHLLEQP